MYKHTRHTNKSWTYANRSLRSPITGTEEESQKVIENCKLKLFSLNLLRPDEFVLDNIPTGVLFSFGRVVNERIRRGCSYLRKLSYPDDLIRQVPNYLVISPKLGAVLSRLEKKSLHQVPPELSELYRYLKVNGAPSRRNSRPVFSGDAIRLKASEIATPAQSGTTPVPAYMKDKPWIVDKLSPKAKAKLFRDLQASQLGQTISTNMKTSIPNDGKKEFAPKKGKVNDEFLKVCIESEKILPPPNEKPKSSTQVKVISIKQPTPPKKAPLTKIIARGPTTLEVAFSVAFEKANK